jgi:plastocyanin
VRRLLILVAASAHLSCVTAPPVTHTVVIEALTFTPAVLTVKPGDSVEWVNKDPFPHTATSQPGAFASKVIAAGQSWKHTMTAKGEFSYVCTLHPTMKGTLLVR